MTKYQIGYRFECAIRNELQKAGCFVLRSAKSGSPIDLVAIKKGSLYFIQCKKDGYLSPAEWNDLYELALSVKATPLLASKPVRGRYQFKCLLKRKTKDIKNQEAIMKNYLF